MAELVIPFSMINSLSLSPLGSLWVVTGEDESKTICGIIKGTYSYSIGDHTEAVKVSSGLRRNMSIEPAKRQSYSYQIL